MLLRCLRVSLVGVLVVTFGALVTDSATAAPALRISRSSVITGETVALTGSVGGRAARAVLLQRRTRAAWVRIATTKTSAQGAFSFRYRPPSSGTQGIRLRVVAPAGTSGARRLPLVVTGTRTVISRTATARLQAPTTLTSTDPVVVRATFVPARPGRVTQVQRLQAGTWTRVASGTQAKDGTTRFTLGPLDQGKQTLRIRTVAAAGAPDAFSPSRKIVVTAPARAREAQAPAGPNGVSAVAGDGEAYVTWDPSTASGLEGYRVYAAPTTDGPWTLLTTDLLNPAHEPTWTVGGLANGTPVAFAVTLTSSGVESPRSESGLVTPYRRTDDCGPVLLKADGTPWTCTLADDFNGTGYDPSRWYPQQNFASGTPTRFACYRNTPETISVGGGVLSLSIARVQQPVSCTFGKLTGSTDLVAGSLMSYQRFVQQYGRFEARIKTQATTAPGLQETFWMWPDDRVYSPDTWPTAGEIDVSETYSSQPHLSIPFLHYREDANGSQHGLNTAWDCAAERGTWNTYTLTWTATRLEIQVNGTTCLVNTSADSAFKKPYMLLFSALLGSTTGNVFDGQVPLPATMQVDYVRAWR